MVALSCRRQTCDPSAGQQRRAFPALVWLRTPLRRWVLTAAIMGFVPLASAQVQVHYRLASREAIATHLREFSTSNPDREERIRKWLKDAGCQRHDLSEQYVPEPEGRKELATDASVGTPPGRSGPAVGEPVGTAEPPPTPNVICVLPGETPEVIVVGAHTDKVTKAGDGVVDNWSGASLLPSLLFSLNGQRRHHTFVFIGFTAEEQGLVGSAYYVDHLTDQQRARIAAMVNLDSLGLGPTEVWASHADQALLDALAASATAARLPVSAMNVDNLGTADSESFARYHIPRITLHSVTFENWKILHSPQDTLKAIQMSDYYDSYHLIAEYLADLDETPGKPAPTAPATSQ